MLNNFKLFFWKKFLVYFTIGQIIIGAVAELSFLVLKNHEYLMLGRFLSNFLILTYYLCSSFFILEVSKNTNEKLYFITKNILMVYYILSLFLFSSLQNFTTIFSYFGSYISTLSIKGIHDNLLLDNFKILFGII